LCCNLFFIPSQSSTEHIPLHPDKDADLNQFASIKRKLVFAYWLTIGISYDKLIRI